MLITCPSCSTSYDVDAASLAPRGRTVRCANCGTKWHQLPVASLPPQQAAPPPPQAPAYVPPYPPQPYAVPPGYPPGYPLLPPGYPHQLGQPPYPPVPLGYLPQASFPAEAPPAIQPPQVPTVEQPPASEPPPQATAAEQPSASEPLPQATAAEQPSASEPPPQVSTVEQPSASEPPPQAIAAEQPPQAIAAEQPPASERPQATSAELLPEDPPTDDELDAMLSTEEEPQGNVSLVPEEVEDLTVIDEDELTNLSNPEPVEPLVKEAPEDGDVVVDPDEIPDPEPIPEVFSEGTELTAEEKGRSWGLVISSALGGLLAILLAVVFLVPGTVVSFVPSTAGLYELVGISTERFGEGLEIRDVNQKRVESDAGDTLVVTGVIENVSEREKNVPMMRIDLYDGNEEIVQSVDFPAGIRRLAPGKNLKFKGEVKNLVPTARRLEVTLSDASFQSEDGEALAGDAKVAK